jgi:hypothetical protein
MRIHSALLVVLVGVLTSGCLRSTTTITLKPDGSGTILQENAVTAQALGMIKSFAASAGQDGKNAAPDLFSQEQAMKTAEAMGVTFVSGEPFKTGELEGYRARYRFDDISKLKVQQAPEAMAGGPSSAQPPFGFALTRGASSSILTIQMPEMKPGAGLPGMPGAAGGDADAAQKMQALSMMKMMMKGLFVDIALEIDGRVIKANNAVDGSRLTLMQIDFDRLMAADASMAKLEAAKDLKALADIPGLKFPTEPKLVVEFSAR